jgi:hypothetical protein
VTHVRRTLREAVKAKLESMTLEGATLSVYTNRVKELEPDKLPAAVIITDEESSERYGKSAALERTIQCSVAIVIDAEKAKDIDDELDAWAERVESVLAAPMGDARLFTLRATSLDIPDPEEGQEWLGFLFLDYEASGFG